MKKKLLLSTCIISLLLTIGMVSAGTVDHGYQGSNVCRNPTDTFITFENGVDLTPITTQYTGVVFSAPAPAAWVFGDVRTGHWAYPTYWANGNFWATLEGVGFNVSGATGRIDFPQGVSYVSVLITGPYPVWMEAYDASDGLIDTAGPTGDNLNTRTMDRLIVSSHSPAVIKYVLIHDTGQFWSMDDVCTDVRTNFHNVPEFPSMFLPITLITGFLGTVLFIKRTRK